MKSHDVNDKVAHCTTDGAKTDSDYDFVYAFYLTGTSHFDAQVLGRVTLVIFVIIPRIYIFMHCII